MADAWGWVHHGEMAGCFVGRPAAVVCVVRRGGCVVPLRVETAAVRHAADLHQVLKDLTGLAKLAACPLNTYKAAIRNADELLKQIERESTEDTNHG